MPFANHHHVENYRIYYEDTDAGGVVYHANYVKFAERARTDALRELGVSQHYLRDTLHIMFVVRQCDVTFIAPSRLDDLITVKTHVLEFGNTSLTLQQCVLRADEKDEVELARLRVQVVCINAAWKPTRIPPEIREAMRKEMMKS